MNAAGLALSVATLWESCLQLFEVVGLTREFGIDYEILSVKLEVERVRLLSWGQAVGLNDATNNADKRLGSAEVYKTVIRLLGCIQHVFEDSEGLQNVYGLRLNQVVPGEGESITAPEELSQRQEILGGIFKRAYGNLRRVALERQRNTPAIRRSKWAVHDRKKFIALVAELRGFNDSLESLFPDIKLKMMKAMQNDIDEAERVEDLQLLRDATEGQEGLEDISERVGMRLDALGASESARTELLSGTRSQPGDREGGNEDRDELETAKDIDENEGEQATLEKQDLDELSSQLKMVELSVKKKNEGRLSFYVIGATKYESRCAVHVLWDGDMSRNHSPQVGGVGGFAPSEHLSFDLYKKKKYVPGNFLTSEDQVLLDPEIYLTFESINPGTVTAEGFGLECWDFEDLKPREHTIMINTNDLPELYSKTIIRRIHEIQTNRGDLSRDRDEVEFNLKQIVGDISIRYTDSHGRLQSEWAGNLFSVLNRTDFFADFTARSSIAMQWGRSPSDDSLGLLYFLRQIIVAWELTERLKTGEGEGWIGFTPGVLASIIICDLWLKHVEVVFIEPKAQQEKPKLTFMEKVKIKDLNRRGEKALKRKEYQTAFDLYTETIKMDPSNVVHWCNRGAAQLGLENWEDAELDAYRATLVDPEYGPGWFHLGMARLRLKLSKQAKKSFEKAIQLAGRNSTAAMRQGLVDATTKITQTLDAIRVEEDIDKRHAMRSNFLDEDFYSPFVGPKCQSLVHERQVEGLLLFAKKIDWPYINETRDYAKDIYTDVSKLRVADVNVLDWLYGTILPGKWFASKIMTALILCTPSVRDIFSGVCLTYDWGFSAPGRSYWRCRTAIGRVLGCLPGVHGLCGWIGPCPPVEFDPPSQDSQKPRYVSISARRVTPYNPKADFNDRNRAYNWDQHNEVTDIPPNEEIGHYIDRMKDSSQWVIPEPPAHEVSTFQLKHIKLRKRPLDINFVGRAEEELKDPDIQYRVSLEFTMDDRSNQLVTYQLLTNPIFVTLPPCRPGLKGSHEVTMLELPRYQKNIWAVEQLKDHTNEDNPESNDDDVMIINATSEGSEVVARAWCSERGRNAIIRRDGGPCFVCAVRSASKRGLDLGTLIWVG